MKFDIWKKSVENIEKEMALKYFKLSEFDSPDSKGKESKAIRLVLTQAI
jgi:hypothetical protein